VKNIAALFIFLISIGTTTSLALAIGVVPYGGNQGSPMHGGGNQGSPMHGGGNQGSPMHGGGNQGSPMHDYDVPRIGDEASLDQNPLIFPMHKPNSMEFDLLIAFMNSTFGNCLKNFKPIKNEKEMMSFTKHFMLSYYVATLSGLDNSSSEAKSIKKQTENYNCKYVVKEDIFKKCGDSDIFMSLSKIRSERLIIRNKSLTGPGLTKEELENIEYFKSFTMIYIDKNRYGK